MAKRIKQYRHVFYSPIEKRIVSVILFFNGHHAIEAGTVEHDGIDVESAKYLMHRWNERCADTSIYLLDIEHS